MILASHLRQFRAVLAVCKTGSTAQAATVLPLSQSAIARAIRELETAIGAPVFDRTARGMVPTPVGQLLAHRAERALNQLALGEREAVLAAEAGPGRNAVGRFAGSAGFRHLQTFIVFCETRSETLAAARLGSASRPSTKPCVN
ncbi:LysR family transcriptional regulator [Neopusillimonas aromaticivorans]|uniref:LysR family transcriptional regulator n=1 Tax=Neopusillimonas aromaticivorans TaxID=2979868 RepID=UPI002599AFC5|nr:LysR family transcriptional regulator [Neopusillimonas aromaticivorans]WJJ92571.1 LysR family transcriptional regulator [Neopusillimonas aromaticivorans]